MNPQLEKAYLKWLSFAGERVLNCFKTKGRFAAIMLCRKETGFPLNTCKTFVDCMLQGIDEMKKVDNEVTVVSREVTTPEFVRQVQELILTNVGKSSVENSGKVESVLSLINTNQPDEVKKYLKYMCGEFGDILLAFASKVHHDHPSLADLNNGTMMRGGKVYTRVNEALALGKIASEEKLVELPNAIRRWFIRNHKSISKLMTKPSTRLLKNDQSAAAARSLLKPKEIDLGKVYRDGRVNNWDVIFGDFLPYTRMGPGFGNRIKYLEGMSKLCADKGLSNQSVAFAKDSIRLSASVNDQYMGFVRIRMIDAALIAAKTMGGVWSKSRSSPRIEIPIDHFKTPFWDCNKQNKSSQQNTDLYVVDTRGDHLRVELNYKCNNLTHFVYSPRAYPIQSFKVKMPPNVAQILKILDSHCDANGHALFDNYWVIVPSIVLPMPNKDHYQFRHDNGVYRSFDFWSYANELDKYLIQTGQIFPVILAEHTSKKSCFFIGYWN